jgi:predicted enzyme related to lactoylglutathione lyase
MNILLSWYPVDDLAVAEDFYTRVLGLKRTFAMPGWIEVSDAESGTPSIGLGQRDQTSPQAGATVVLRVESLEAERQRLEAMGVKFVGEPIEIPGVVRLLTFEDVSGNRLQLLEDLTQQKRQ